MVSLRWVRYRQNLELTVGHIFAEALGIEDRLFPGGVGVEVSPHVLHLHLKLSLRPLAGTFEDHVLQEVCHPIVPFILVTTSSINP